MKGLCEHFLGVALLGVSTVSFASDGQQDHLKEMLEKIVNIDDPNICLEEEKPKKVISDSLVKNLACDSLTKDNVLSSLQDDAFSDDKQIPFGNWYANSIGQCWGMAFTQRRIFYLSRFTPGAEVKKLDSHKKSEFLKLVSNHKPEGVVVLPSSRLSNSSKYLKEISDLVVSLDTQRGNKDIGEKNKKYAAISTHSYADLIGSGDLVDSLNESIDGKSFKSKIEDLQKKLFFRVSNIHLVAGSMIRSPSENKKTISDLEQKLKAGRLPIIIVRSKVLAQHAVLVKRIEKEANGEIRIICYDSNVPGREVAIDYHNGEFSSLFLVSDSEQKEKIGVHIKDEEDMDHIQDTLYKYYRGLCEKL